MVKKKYHYSYGIPIAYILIDNVVLLIYLGNISDGSYALYKLNKVMNESIFALIGSI